MSEPRYPEHEKLQAVHPQSQACGEFVDWLRDEAKIVLARRHRHHYSCYMRGEHIALSQGALRCTRCTVTREKGMDALTFFKRHSHSRLTCDAAEGELLEVQVPLRQLLAMRFGIDEDRLEAEKRAMLEELHRER